MSEIGPLVSQAGLLFVPQEWNLVVLDGASGATRWTGAEGASPMAAAVTPLAVYTCAVGGGVTASDPSTGTQLWLHQPDGDGGGGCFTVVGGDEVYAYDWADPPLVLNPGNGAVETGFTGPAAPAFDTGRAYFLNGQNLEAHDANNTVLWTFAGDGTLDTQPIAGGGYVYVGGSSGMLYAVDKNGQVAYSDQLPSALTATNTFVNGTAPSGFAIAEDKLFVSAGTILLRVRHELITLQTSRDEPGHGFGREACVTFECEGARAALALRLRSDRGYRGPARDSAFGAGRVTRQPSRGVVHLSRAALRYPIMTCQSAPSDYKSRGVLSGCRKSLLPLLKTSQESLARTRVLSQHSSQKSRRQTLHLEPETDHLLHVIASSTQLLAQLVVVRPKQHRVGKTHERSPGMRVYRSLLELAEVIGRERQEVVRPDLLSVGRPPAL